MNTTHKKNTTGLIRKWFTRSVACMALLFAAWSGSAATLTKSASGIWDYNNTLFSSASNWTNNTDTAQFNTKGITINVSTNNGPVGASGLIFPTSGVTFTNQPLQIGAGGISTTPQNNCTLVFSNDLQLTVSQVWSMAPRNSDFAVYGNLSGTGTTANLIFDALGYNGRLILYGSNSLSGTMTVQNTGRLLLDYGATRQNNSKLDPNNALILNNSADIQWQGGAGAFTQAVNGLTISGPGYFYLYRVNSNNVLQVGQITRTGVGSTLLLGNSSGAVTTSSSNQNGIIGAWATTANGWAYNTTDAANGPLAGFLGTNDTNSVVWTTTENVNMNAGTVTMAGNKTINTLRLGGTTSFNLGGNELTLNAGGLMAASATPTLSNGSIQSGLASGELFVYANTVNLTNSATIKDNSATPTVLVKAGANTLVLGGYNTYSGATYVNQGTLLLADGGTLGTNAINVGYNGTLTFNRSDTFSLTNTITGSGNGNGIVQNIGPGVVNLTTSNSIFGLPHIVYNSFQSQMKNTGSGTLNVNLGGTNVFGIIDNSGSGKLTLTGKDAVNTVVSLTVSGSGGGMILTNVSVNTINAGGNQGNMSVIGSAANSVGCYLLIAGTNGPNQQTTYSGGWMYIPSSGNTSSSNNYVMVSEGGVLTNCTLYFGGYAATGPNNGLIITNGGRAYISLGLGVGGSSSNYIYVGGTDSRGNNALLNSNGGVLYVGQGQQGPGAYGNWMKVDQGGVVISVGASIGNGTNCAYNRAQVTGSGLWNVGGSMSVGVGSYIANFNSLLVDNGGMATNITTLNVGVAGLNANNYSNVVSVTSGGLLEVKTGISVANNTGATSSGNYVTNSGGILQFTTATPAISIGNSTQNGIVIADATISYKGLLVAGRVNLTNNWGNSGIGTNGVAWSGNNTLRLHSSAATNSLGWPYVFDTNLGPTNYVNLELLGNSTIYGKGITLGANGSMRLSDAVATISGGVTNFGCIAGSGTVSGLVTMASGSILSPAGTGKLAFSTNLTFTGTSTYNWNYNASTCSVVTVGGTLTLPTTMNLTVIGSGELPADTVFFTWPTGTTAPSTTWNVSPAKYAVKATPTGYVLTIRAGTLIKFY